MCVTCQMQLVRDHLEKKGPFCPKCHRYRLGIFVIAGDGGQTCSHCFEEESDGEVCPVCAPEIPEEFFDPHMANELKAVELARAERIEVN